MKGLKSVSCALVLSCVFSVAAFAGEVHTPSAPGDIQGPPCAPGEIHGPPCESVSSSADSTIPGDIHGPPSAEILMTGVGLALQLLIGV